jgi:hypothetical protein
MDNLHEALQEAVIQFRNAQAALESLNDFDDRMAASEKRLYRGDQPTPSQAVARALFEISRDYLFLHRVSEIKIKYVIDGLQRAVEDKNPIVEFALLRSLVEHLAAFCFQVETICQFETQVMGQNSEKKIEEAFVSCRRTLVRLYYGRSFTTSAAHKRFHVNDFIRSLEKHVTDIAEVYDYLCDFVHPNYGSNLLVSTGTLGSGRLDPPADTHTEHLSRACVYALRALTKVEDLARSGGAALIRLDNYVVIAMMPHQRVGAIFAQKPLTYQGDGKNKESAITFTKVRTSLEAVDMIYRYLETKGIEITGPQVIGAVEDGFIFDVFHTTQGTLWFRTPMQKT